MSWSRTKTPLLGAAVLATGLAGCSDIYFERREHIVPYAGDAIAANRVTQMVDPWPPSSANRNIAFNGEVMQRAVERYREGRVIPPVNATTSSIASAKAQATAATAAQSARASTSTSSTPSAWAAKPGPNGQTQAPSQPAPQPQYPDDDPGETR